MVLSVQVT